MSLRNTQNAAQRGIDSQALLGPSALVRNHFQKPDGGSLLCCCDKVSDEKESTSVSLYQRMIVILLQEERWLCVSEQDVSSVGRLVRYIL